MVVINSDSSSLDRIFTYRIPDKFKNDAVLGSRVIVPFGKGNKKIQAFVLNVTDTIDFDEKKAKDIISVEDVNLFDINDLKMALFIKKKFLCRLIESIKLFLPPGIIKGNSAKTKSVICINNDLKDEQIDIISKYNDIYEFIKNNNGKYTKTELTRDNGLSLYKINKMIQLGILFSKDDIVNRYNDKKYDHYERKELTEEQRDAVNTILYSDNNLFLLKGVTGSGKTEVYMHIVEEMLINNKDTIILVPEISLTPQMIERFKGRFGKYVAVFHSKLSDGERFDEWNRVKNGEVKLAVGARSAIFLPFKNLGCIIVDEEHEDTYKSEQSPKYNVKDVAEFKSRLNDVKIVYGSATPSIETYYRTTTGEIKLVELNHRVDKSSMPPIHVVDMREELASGNRSIFSKKLYDAINDRLKKKEQIILFLNRRGYSTFVSCRKCGYVFKCDSCDIAMTYHNKGYLECHYCGKRKPQPKICPKCGSKYVKFFGAGTEQIEHSIRETFKDASVLRMDVDTTRKKNSHEEIYNKFKNGEADILIGTQMIAKGLDFPNVTLVGIIAADTTLNLPDYKSSERGFQLITQVSGRAGRAEKKGEVILQTYEPSHSCIINASSYDYDSFYKEESGVRRIMGYPPFGDITSINLTGSKESNVKKCSEEVATGIKEFFKSNNDIEIFGPSECGVKKIKDQFRWKIIVKGKLDDNINNSIKELVYGIIKNNYADIKISLDVNPINLF